VATVVAPNEIDMATAPRFQSMLEAALAAGTAVGERELLVDCSHIQFIDSSGLRALALVQGRLPSGHRLVLLGASDQLVRLLDIAGIQDRFILRG
jgi:anti-anti-sigma factor